MHGILVAKAVVLLTTGFLSSQAIVSGPQSPDDLVRQLGELGPAGAPGIAGAEASPRERLRADLYARLIDYGDEAIDALARGLSDPDVFVRRQVLLFLTPMRFMYEDPPWRNTLDVSRILPQLIESLEDPDDTVRSWAAQAIGYLGADGAEAVPALIVLLDDPEEGPRISATIGLRGIGTAATAALPALRDAVNDPSSGVSTMAASAIERIEAGGFQTIP